ncbi:MAG: metal ABC transporter permease [Muribaculaceae bacterium]|nr:metal ABC transporter permease [Muribaculaceae bacterium]
MNEITIYLQYDFFRYALCGVVLISMCAAIIGTYIISRRLVAISGGVTHACFGGLGLGYFLGVSPVAMAAAVAVLASTGVEWASSRFRIREDSAIAVIWALGMAVGVLFVFLTPGYVPELNSFLFGNILTINRSDLLAFAVYAVVLAVFLAWRYRMIVACAFDRDFARVSGLPVRFITYSMTVLVAVCIVLTIRLVGVMLLMSMLSLPMMTAEIWSRRFGPMMLWSMIISVVTSVAGLVAGTLVDVPCSALIVLAMAAVFIISKMTSEIIMIRKNS